MMTTPTPTASKRTAITPTKRARTNEAGSSTHNHDGLASNGAAFSKAKSDADGGSGILDPIFPHVFTACEDLATAYRDAQPYPHGVIRDFCKKGFMGERDSSKISG